MDSKPNLYAAMLLLSALSIILPGSRGQSSFANPEELWQNIDADSDYYCNKFCNNTHPLCFQQFSSRNLCPSDYEIINLDEHQEFILDFINVKRNSQALGNESVSVPAFRMTTTQWDKELEDMAKANAYLCGASHDSCLTTERFQLVGQTMGWFRARRTNTSSNRGIIEYLLNMLWNEVNDAQVADVLSYKTR